MAIDTSIYGQIKPLQIENQLTQFAQVQAIQQGQNTNRLADLVFGEKQRTQQGEAALSELIGAGKTGADVVQGLGARGFGGQALQYGKTFADQQKAQAELEKNKLAAAKQKLEVAGQAFGYVRNNPTLEAAVSTLDYLGANGIYSPEQVAQYKSVVTADPTKIKSLADQAFMSVLAADKQLPSMQTRNTGGTTDTIAVNPVTQQATVVNSVKNTQSPDSIASNETQRRGQNMVDSRAKEGNEIQRQAARTQVVETPEGVMLVDKGTGATLPAKGADGKPLAGKPNSAVHKELLSIDQQFSVIDGAINSVKSTPAAFGMKRGLATMAGAIPESVAGRFDTDAERQARAYVFNNVSRVINERAGAAQSAQELARLRAFLPAETDSAEQIESKLNGFKQYLADLRTGTTGKPQSVVKVPPANQVPTSGIKFLGFEKQDK